MSSGSSHQDGAKPVFSGIFVQASCKRAHVVFLNQHTQRVQVPNISGLCSQIPFRVCFWTRDLNIGCLDPLGYSDELSCITSASPNLQSESNATKQEAWIMTKIFQDPCPAARNSPKQIPFIYYRPQSRCYSYTWNLRDSLEQAPNEPQAANGGGH